MRVQMRALEMFGRFMQVLFMIGVWKCHLDTCILYKDHFDILAASGCSQSEQQRQAVPLPLPSLIEAYDVIVTLVTSAFRL